jgi:hypothetical protein
LPLPEAYRSLSRPSSPVSTKASTVCPKKLDSMFEISHADLSSLRRRFPRFADLAIRLQPASIAVANFGFTGCFCRKNYVFGNQNIFKDHVRTARGITPVHSVFLQSIKSYFSPYGCQRADSSCLVRNQPCVSENGGPDRTRTYDPRLIKAVL